MRTFLRALLREYRTRRMARFTTWVLAYGLALWLVDRFTAGGAPIGLWFGFWITFIPAAIYYLFRIPALIRERLLWRLRRRLIITYTFIGFVPIALILILVGLGAFIINGQFAAYLVNLRIRHRVDELQQLNRAVAHEARQTRELSSGKLIDHLQAFFTTQLREHASDYPGLRITLRLGNRTAALRIDGGAPVTAATVPPWLKGEEFKGMVSDDGLLALCSLERTSTPFGELAIILSQRFTPGLLNALADGIGPVGVITPEPKSGAKGADGGKPIPHTVITTPDGRTVPALSFRSDSVEIPARANRLDFGVYGASTLEPVDWNSAQGNQTADSGLIYVNSRIFALNRQLLALGLVSKVYVAIFEVVAGFFLLIEIAAIVVGYRLTTSMTRTVDNLQQATERVRQGDFSHRINLPARDQLSALGSAFDGMTASVERLLRESMEKSRLESELEIAREVQRQLFPQEAPQVKGLRLYGICHPARVVSGDYYDFLRLGEEQVGVVVGDISGKGISAALLMASIQSAVHSQFDDGTSAEARGRMVMATDELVARLNRQVYQNTPIEKYATFFYSVYDSTTRTLTYTNAGHPPPVLFRDGNEILRLDQGGTVVGLFSKVEYQRAAVELQPGDVLLAYTDGLIEPENEYAEEFGEERFLRIARRALSSPPELLAEEIYRNVSDWTGSPELQDDMTIVIAKAF